VPAPVLAADRRPVYDPELAHCCSCEPKRAAAITIRMEKERAEAMLACLEVRRRQLLLQKGELAPFAS
jgi:hypothetical protein